METIELNYYKTRLEKYLNDGFPELANNPTFIKERSDSAAETYEAAFLAGNPIEVCKEEANQVLFEGLYFSKLSTIVEVLIKEFENTLSEEQFRPFAHAMLNICEPVFKKYELHDDFAYSPEYDHLYTELTGVIARWFKQNGLPE